MNKEDIIAIVILFMSFTISLFVVTYKMKSKIIEETKKNSLIEKSQESTTIKKEISSSPRKVSDKSAFFFHILDFICCFLWFIWMPISLAPLRELSSIIPFVLIWGIAHIANVGLFFLNFDIYHVSVLPQIGLSFILIVLAAVLQTLFISGITLGAIPALSLYGPVYSLPIKILSFRIHKKLSSKSIDETPESADQASDITVDLTETNEKVTEGTGADCKQKEPKDKPKKSPSKKRLSLTPTILCICLTVILVVIGVLCGFLISKNNTLQNENNALKGSVTSEELTGVSEEPENGPVQLSFEDDSFDPCGFMDDNYAFDKTPNHYISELKKGIDYSVSDSYGGSGLRTYIIYPDYEYMGAKSNKSSIGFTAKNEKSDIDSITYFFDIDKSDAEQILNMIHDGISKTCGNYVSCTGNYVSVGGSRPVRLPLGGNGLIGSNSEEKNDKKEDEESKDKDIEFSRLVDLVAGNGKSGRGKGVFRVTWDTKGYTITLTVNTDTGSNIFEGSVCISTIE
ncbi:MAG: hypothetical protein E7578_07300 [Ruminococcaceae bacterium]|nr:hypothetical protein [Oscillospiraceae bacterium]